MSKNEITYEALEKEIKEKLGESGIMVLATSSVMLPRAA